DNEDSSAIDFVNYLNLLDEANAVFSVEEFADRNSVQILTSHGAKGLEFDYVFVVNAVSGRFPGTRRSDPFNVPAELTTEIYPEGDFHLQEERRLFYVAMTRARKQLFLSYSEKYEGNKKWQVSPFVKEVLENKDAVLTKHESSDDALKRLREFKEPNKPIFDLPPFDTKRLSYSQFDAFKTCPLKYNYSYLMKVPAPTSHAASFGSSVHGTLKDFYRMLKDGAEPSFELLTELYEKNWISYGYENMDHEEKRKEKGLELLKIFFEKNSSPWIVPAFLERPFNIRVGEYFINGRIDRIDLLADGTYEVWDYKTGSKPSYINLGKDLQLSIYALAARDILKIKVSKLSLYYLNDNEKISTSRTDADLDFLAAELTDLIREMQNSKFAPTPGFHCGFCDFRIICPAV
ncbi:ATP-dependent helicase, partial [Candidatus Peregrinibacteria bacterium]|nr:ATP-dependent helicase [Candidatus Peregrinibacteria bacterium]